MKTISKLARGRRPIFLLRSQGRQHLPQDIRVSVFRLRCQALGASMDSYRTEAFGLLSLAILLDLMSKLFHSPLPAITIGCDNLSVVQTINSIITRARPVFPDDTLRPSWDIIQATCRTFQAHPSRSLQHVKGHQDRTTNFVVSILKSTQYTSRQTRYRPPREIQSPYGSWSNDPRVWVAVSHGKSSYPKKSLS
jgi:hypothetical protein